MIPDPLPDTAHTISVADLVSHFFRLLDPDRYLSKWYGWIRIWHTKLNSKQLDRLHNCAVFFSIFISFCQTPTCDFYIEVKHEGVPTRIIPGPLVAGEQIRRPFGGGGADPPTIWGRGINYWFIDFLVHPAYRKQYGKKFTARIFGAVGGYQSFFLVWI